MSRKLEDLTLDEWRALGEKRAARRSAADRADAPLLARMIAEDAMRAARLLGPHDRLRVLGDGTYEVVRNAEDAATADEALERGEHKNENHASVEEQRDGLLVHEPNPPITPGPATAAPPPQQAVPLATNAVTPVVPDDLATDRSPRWSILFAASAIAIVAIGIAVAWRWPSRDHQAQQAVRDTNQRHEQPLMTRHAAPAPRPEWQYSTGFIDLLTGSLAFTNEASTVSSHFPLAIHGGIRRTVPILVDGFNGTNEVIVVGNGAPPIEFEISMPDISPGWSTNDAWSVEIGVEVMARYGRIGSAERDERLRIGVGPTTFEIADPGDRFVFDTYTSSEMPGFDSGAYRVRIEGIGTGEVELGAIRIHATVRRGHQGDDCVAEFTPASQHIALGTCDYRGPGIYEGRFACRHAPDITRVLTLLLRNETDAVLLNSGDDPSCNRDTNPIHLSVHINQSQAFGHVSGIQDGIVHIAVDRVVNPPALRYFNVFRPEHGPASFVGIVSIADGEFAAPETTAILVRCSNELLPQPGDVVLRDPADDTNPVGHLVPASRSAVTPSSADVMRPLASQDMHACTERLAHIGPLGRRAQAMYRTEEAYFWSVLPVMGLGVSQRLTHDVGEIQRRAPAFGESAASCATSRIAEVSARLPDVSAAEHDEQLAIQARDYDRYTAARQRIVSLQNQLTGIIEQASACLGPDSGLVLER